MFGRLLLDGLVLFLVTTLTQAVAAVDVYILTGQSNSLGTTSLEGSSYFPVTLSEDAKIPFFWANAYGYGGYPLQLYGTSGNKILTLRMQQGDSANPSFWGPEYGFGRTRYEAGRTNFLIIKASNGGGGNTLWDKTTFDTNHAAGPMWGHLSNTVNTALGVLAASGRGFNVRGLLYIQGEGNSSGEAVIAGSRFSQLCSNLISAINASYPGTATGMRAVIGEIGSSQHNGTTQITTTQQVAAAFSNNTLAFVSTRDQPVKSDNLHFPKSAKLEIGRRMANCFLGRPTIVSVGFDGVTNAPDGTAVTFERYVPDTNGPAGGINLNLAGLFTGFADGANRQPPAGLLASGSSGNVVFADYYSNSVSSDIACGQYDFAGHGLPSNWTDSGTAVSFPFADPANPASSALVSSAAFEIVAPSTDDTVSVAIVDGRGDALYTSGVITNGRFGFEAHESFSKVLTSAVACVTLQGATNVLWTIGHITDGGAPDFAWNGWRIPSGYERWSFQIPDPTQRGANADPDGDGALNLLEYRHGHQPHEQALRRALARGVDQWRLCGLVPAFDRGGRYLAGGKHRGRFRTCLLGHHRHQAGQPGVVGAGGSGGNRQRVARDGAGA